MTSHGNASTYAAILWINIQHIMIWFCITNINNSNILEMVSSLVLDADIKIYVILKMTTILVIAPVSS